MINQVDSISVATGEKRSTVIQALIQRGFAHMKIIEDSTKELSWEEVLEQARTSHELLQTRLMADTKRITIRKSPKKESKEKGEVSKPSKTSKRRTSKPSGSGKHDNPKEKSKEKGVKKQ